MNKFELEFAATVGIGIFAADMLRYDHCVPADEASADAVARNDYNGERLIFLKRYKGQPGTWTPARWKSFGWELILDGNRPFKSLGDAKRATEKLAEVLTKQRI